ncbi:MAG: mechanosensitive ion channel [Nitrospirae bacterium]|nr:mechanosensitive ion channel [Nitrospirota bacterium]MCL5976971.1 mechanosensitive ion channel [Nitrospirota bacterium]
MTGVIESLNISASPYINAILSIVAFVVIAKAADLFVGKVLSRFTKFTKSDIDDRVLDTVHRPVYFTIILIGVVLAIAYLKPSQKVLFYADGIIYSVMTVIWMMTAVKISNIVIEDAIHKVSDVTGLSKDIIPLIENVSKIAIIIAALMVALSLWKINITPIIASAGIAGAAVALAAKDTIANFFGGLSVFADRPFKIGDFIVIDKGERGEVVAIGIRSTRIKTLDDVMITIPNAIIAGSKIVNESAPTPNLRVRIPVNVAYGSDIDLVEKTLIEIALQNGNILNDPAPKVFFNAFGDSALNLELLCWIKEPALRLRTVDEINRGIYKKFSERGIKIPFPQREVHLYQG